MGMVIAVVAGLIIGFALGEVASALALAVLAGLLVKYRALSQLVGNQQEQILFLTKKLIDSESGAASVTAKDAAPAAQAFAQAASGTASEADTAAVVPDPVISNAPAPSDDSYVNEPPPAKTPWVEPAIADSALPPTPANPAPPAPTTSDKLIGLWSSSSIGKLVARTNMITRVGIVILFLGVSFLVKYASQSITVPIEVRFLGIAGAALLVFLLGWRLRHTRRDYALLLQGAAVGTWYLVTFASMKVYPVVPPSFGFFLLVGLSVFAALMSVKQDAKSLAVFGILGGFLAPILASTGGGSHVMLFSYYAILNAGILAIVWFKAWRALTLMGFIFTFIICVAWGVMRYQADLFATTEPFLLLFMLFYVAVVLIFALRKRWPPHRLIDGPILFGTPVIGFGLQAILVEQFEYGMAWSALGFGLFYLGITALCWKTLTERALLLRESLTAIGVVMLTLAVPYAFDHDVTALVWAFEGAAAIWLSARQQRNWAGLLALVVQVGAAVSWLLSAPSAGEYLFINAGYASIFAIAMVALWSAWILRAQPDSYWVRMLHLPVLGWALLWWFAGGIWQMHAHLSQQQMWPGLLCFVSLSFIALQWLRMRYQWQALAPVLLALLPLAVGLILRDWLFGPHPFSSFGYIAWPLTFATLYWLYNRRDFFSGVISKAEEPWHLVSYLTMTIVVVLEMEWQVQQLTGVDSWYLMGVGLVPLMAIGVALKTRLWRARLDPLYRHSAVAILFTMLLLNVLIGCLIRPVVSPLPYWPLLNPLDLWQVGVLICAGWWWRSIRHTLPPAIAPVAGIWVLAGLGFIYLNTLLLRTVHAFTGVAFHIEQMLHIDLVQTCLSVFWTLLGVALLMAANRLINRQVWMVGMALIAVVVAKLLLVDLSNSGTVERIVSFIVVGLLLLGVGYLVPLPEKPSDVDNREEEPVI